VRRGVLQCLFDGGSVTVDATTGGLVLASGEMLRDMIDGR
jgi:hypothetical protein